MKQFYRKFATQGYLASQCLSTCSLLCVLLYVCTSLRSSWLISDCHPLCSPILHASQPQKINMTNLPSYPGLLKHLLKSSEKVERYRHHITFNSTYLELNVIPKGFRLKSHNNIDECDPAALLKKCSTKLMVKTIGCYKTKLKTALRDFDSTHNKLLQHCHIIHNRESIRRDDKETELDSSKLCEFCTKNCINLDNSKLGSTQ